MSSQGMSWPVVNESSGLDKGKWGAELCEAARRGDEDEIQELLAEGADFSAMESDRLQSFVRSAAAPRRTALMHAAAAGHAGCVALLAKAGGVDMRDEEGWTALSLAALEGHAHCVEAIAPWAGKESQLSAIYTAASGARLGCLAPLLALRDARGGEAVRGFTALMLAAGAARPIKIGSVERMGCVMALMPASDPKAVDHEGIDAPGHARRRGDEEMARWMEAWSRAQEEASAMDRCLRTVQPAGSPWL